MGLFLACVEMVYLDLIYKLIEIDENLKFILFIREKKRDS